MDGSASVGNSPIRLCVKILVPRDRKVIEGIFKKMILTAKVLVNRAFSDADPACRFDHSGRGDSTDSLPQTNLVTTESAQMRRIAETVLENWKP